jgi:hypothetical protein
MAGSGYVDWKIYSFIFPGKACAGRFRGNIGLTRSAMVLYIPIFSKNVSNFPLALGECSLPENLSTIFTNQEAKEVYMKVTGAETIVKCLEEQGVEVMFGFPGGVIIDLFEVK